MSVYPSQGGGVAGHSLYCRMTQLIAFIIIIFIEFYKIVAKIRSKNATIITILCMHNSQLISNIIFKQSVYCVLRVL